MIYCVTEKELPLKKDILEETDYKDENGCDWKVLRTEKDLFVLYLGEPYFSDSTFECQILDNKYIRVKNTNIILFKDTNFDIFYNLRIILKEGFTDDIWESFLEFFTERLKLNKTLLDSEK